MISLALLALLPAPALTQHFAKRPDLIPQGTVFNDSYSENVDFADVDLDGDWDAVFADGGDVGNDQNRIWINQGGVQAGTTGFFEDETLARFPTGPDASRDVEFADFDADGDQDLFVANHSTISPQSSRWWVNVGLSQGGQVGFYVDETAQRWVGIAGVGSSVASDVALASGGFRAFSGDGDFADLDNDGDLDLVHSSYGPAFTGRTPTRIFLNDGNGFFEEFNPSGFQLTSQNILDGDPGLWCEGIQAGATTDSTGAFCDVSSDALDIDLGDIDQDFDLDILHGARSELPRMYANRMEASSLAPGGAWIFRDVTGLVFPPDYATGTGHYEQEMGDLDGDGDLDIFGLNWSAGTFFFDDVTLANDGTGFFGDRTVLAASLPDDNEGDFLDYDGDGDLDLYVANFSGQDRLYRNDNNGGSTFALSNVTGNQLPNLPDVALDADAADLDGDGDYDVMIAQNFGPNVLLENVGNGTDMTPAHLPNVEQAPDRACGYDPTVVRAQVYDNAPYYITQYNETFVEVSVDGMPSFTIPARSSGGQIFRAEIPGWLTGTICVTWHSRDEHGNEGVSTTTCYEASGSCSAPESYCQPASANSVSPTGAKLSHLTGTPGEVMNFRLDDAPMGQFGILYFGPGQMDQPFGCGRRCVAGIVIRSAPYLISSTSLQLTVDTDPPAGVPQPANFQFWYRDPANAASCGSPFNLSDAVGF